ncbi:2-dehydro-3-deoxygalactonokinase [Rhabdaerophilum sp. SD176]|uniref:2-dehydro-3-deoxygalactonokinase n=1 Tax=Rhabdaerophilum sp. SD176 TaxID=2983548 RepID=UPI0024DF6B46|nr:2-dehydro-3-deoxygalactonokinase [Rhabdaerophilum sp. SD176]
MAGREAIIIDWGTTNFRAYRFDSAGEPVAEHRAAAGILSVADGAFEAVLDRQIGAWITSDSELLFSGMITSRNGWVETPYAETPASLEALAAASVHRRHASGATMRFLPGVAMRHPVPDVMRGEEIQVFGACVPEEESIVVLPGTHSKWVRHHTGRIEAFHTFMTGEIYAALKGHTILGRLLPEGATGAPGAFAEGVRHMRSHAGAGLLHAAFSARSRVLFDELAPADIGEYLSGIVIGAEMAGGLALGWNPASLRLVGEPPLTARYAEAARIFGLASQIAPADTTIRGFRRLAALKEPDA